MTSSKSMNAVVNIFIADCYTTEAYTGQHRRVKFITIDKKNQLAVNAEFKLIHRTVINMTITKWESETCYTVNYSVLTGQAISILNFLCRMVISCSVQCIERY